MNEILTIACLCWLFAEGSGMPKFIKRALFIFDIYYKKDPNGNKMPHDKLLPLDCTKCLSFWVGLTYSMNSGVLDALIFAGLCGFIGTVISKVLWRLR